MIKENSFYFTDVCIVLFILFLLIISSYFRDVLKGEILLYSTRLFFYAIFWSAYLDGTDRDNGRHC